MSIGIYVMRHGAKETGVDNDLARLTKEGCAQVKRSAANNLVDVQFSALYCSEKFRALQTIACAVSALPERNNGLGIKTEIGFDYTGAPDLEQYGWMSKEVAMVATSSGQQPTVAMWMETAPAMIAFLRERFTKTLLAVAHYEHVGVVGGRDIRSISAINILIASHSPVAELACMEPENTPMLHEADIMKYTIDVYTREMVITDVKYIPRGF